MLRPSLLTFLSPHRAPPDIYTLSLHDALPISATSADTPALMCTTVPPAKSSAPSFASQPPEPHTQWASGSYTNVAHRSEEHTSELQSHSDLVCRLLLEKKKKKHTQSSAHNEYR